MRYLRREIQLLHTARSLRPQDEHDFAATLPLLEPRPRAWLRDALRQAHPGPPVAGAAPLRLTAVGLRAAPGRSARGDIGYTDLMGGDPALIRMLRAGRDEGRDLDRALDGLARVFGRVDTAERIGAHVTCAEANVIAYALAASRHTDAAIVWLDAHAVTDEEDDVHGGDDFDAVHYITGGR